jgi:hypothetical protein
MRPHEGGIEKALGGHLPAVLLQGLPEALPEGTGVPAAPSVIERLPVPTVSGEIPPRETGTRVIEHGFDKQAVTALRRTASMVLQGTHNGCQFSPHCITDDKA